MSISRTGRGLGHVQLPALPAEPKDTAHGCFQGPPEDLYIPSENAKPYILKPGDVPANPVDPSINPNAHAEPTIGCQSNQWTSVEFKPTDAKASGPSADDIQQGYQGDCYFESTLAGLAQRDPNAILSMLRRNPDGTCAVRLYAKHSDGKLVPTWISVDDKYPAAGNHIDACSWGAPWAQVIQKAYAKLRGGFPTVQNQDQSQGLGAVPSWAIETLTGQKACELGVNPDKCLSKPDTDALADAIRRGLEKGPVCASTAKGIPEQGPLIGFHCYTVLGVETLAGQTYVQLRNPWGLNTPGIRGRQDGVFDLRLSDFMKNFASVSVTNDATQGLKYPGTKISV